MRKSIAIKFIKKRLEVFCLILYISISVNIFGQSSSKIDSIFEVLKTEENDTSKVNKLNEFAWEYRTKNAEAAMRFAKQAKTISDSLSFVEGTLTSLNRKASILLLQGKTQEAKELYLDILEKEKARKDDFGMGRALNQLGIILAKEGDLKRSIEYAILAEDKFQLLGREDIVANTSINIGDLYRRQGNYESAMHYYLKSKEIIEKIGKKNQLAECNLNLGVFHIELKNYPKALAYLQESESVFKKLDDLYSLSRVYTNLGVVYYNQKNDQKALQFYQRSIQIRKQLNLNDMDALSYNNIGNIHYRKGDDNTAIEYYQKSLQVKNTSKTHNNLGHVYYRKKDFIKAIDSYTVALEIANKNGQKFERMNALTSLSNSYVALKKYNEALYYNSAYLSIRDSIEEEYRSAIFAKEKFEEDKKKLELLEKDSKIIEVNLEKQKVENEQQILIIYGLIGGLVLISLLFFSIHRGNRQKQTAKLAEKNRLIEQQKVEELLKKQELKSINAMMVGQEEERKRIARDLHDRLGSMLSMVKIHFKSVEDGLDELKSSNKSMYEKANKLLDEACEEVRKISHDIDTGVLTQFGLVAALEDLKDALEQSNQLEVEFVVHGLQDRLELQLEIALYRIVQELVSNILKYAKTSEITIQLVKGEEMLNLLVEDSGVGFDTSKEYQGMGLKNIASRVDAFSGELNIDSSLGKGTTVSIDFPLKNNEL
jgi:signal transduction histidine kinase